MSLSTFHGSTITTSGRLASQASSASSGEAASTTLAPSKASLHTDLHPGATTGCSSTMRQRGGYLRPLGTARQHTLVRGAGHPPGVGPAPPGAHALTGAVCAQDFLGDPGAEPTPAPTALAALRAASPMGSPPSAAGLGRRRVGLRRAARRGALGAARPRASASRPCAASGGAPPSPAGAGLGLSLRAPGREGGRLPSTLLSLRWPGRRAGSLPRTPFSSVWPMSAAQESAVRSGYVYPRR